MTQLVQGKRLAWNSLLNLGTGGLLLLLSIVFTPFMLHKFGVELFGVLTVTWMVLANLAWLDFGFSRASARYVARELAVGDTEQATMWSWTAMATQLTLGTIGAAAVWLSATALVELMHVQPERKGLVTLSLRLFALAVPLELAGRSLAGVLEAGQRFDWINGLNLFNSLATYAVYGIGIWRDGDFRTVLYGLFALRFLSLAGYYIAACRILPPLAGLPPLALVTREYRTRARAMIAFGSWITVAAAIWPLTLYINQWTISALLGIAALPFYTVPFGLLMRLAILPNSLTTTLFPAYTTMSARTEWARLEGYYVRSHRYLFAVLLPLLFVLFVWTPELLRVWLGAEFAAHAALPMRILVVGFGIGYTSALSGALLEGIGRPDVLAKLYLVQFPFNVLLVYLLTKNYGITGAAIFYVVRCTVDLFTLWIVIYKLLPHKWTWPFRRSFTKTACLLAASSLLAYLLSNARLDDIAALSATVAALVVYGVSVPVFLFDQFDRDFFRRMLQRRAG